MKYCKKCGIEEPKDQPEPEPADKKTLTRQWIGLLVGIPLFIMAIYVVIYMLYARG